MSRIRRTDQDGPEMPVLAGLVGGPDGFTDYVTGQEAQGQQQLVRSSQLPRAGLQPRGLELGITVVGVGGDDPLFVDVTLPEGWRIEPTDHAMYSNLVDAEDVKRASIFYKAAFYDRSAFIRWLA